MSLYVQHDGHKQSSHRVDQERKESGYLETISYSAIISLYITLITNKEISQEHKKLVQ